MGYELQAVVAGRLLIEELAGRFKHAVAVPLEHGLALIPASGGWIQEVGGRESSPPRPFPEFETLTSPVAFLLAASSIKAPVAYIEYFEFGNESGEAAAAWSGGTLVLPPAELKPGAGRPPEGGPILKALQVLGAKVDPGRDDFESFGLAKFHRMEEWLEIPGIVQRLPGMELAWQPPEHQWPGFKTDYEIAVGGYHFYLTLNQGESVNRCRVSYLRGTMLELADLPPSWRLPESESS